MLNEAKSRLENSYIWSTVVWLSAASSLPLWSKVSSNSNVSSSLSQFHLNQPIPSFTSCRSHQNHTFQNHTFVYSINGYSYWLRCQVPFCALILILSVITSSMHIIKTKAQPLYHNHLWIPCSLLCGFSCTELSHSFASLVFILISLPWMDPFLSIIILSKIIHYCWRFHWLEMI